MILNLTFALCTAVLLSLPSTSCHSKGLFSCPPHHVHYVMGLKYSLLAVFGTLVFLSSKQKIYVNSLLQFKKIAF